jgi:hypothetical protein
MVRVGVVKRVRVSGRFGLRKNGYGIVLLNNIRMRDCRISHCWWRQAHGPYCGELGERDMIFGHDGVYVKGWEDCQRDWGGRCINCVLAIKLVAPAQGGRDGVL